jgi:glycosyltransferase involved in cell wall biosynthesis
VSASDLCIGLVGPLPPPSGGMANQTLQLAKLLRAEGATVELIQVNAPYSPQWIGKLKGIRALFRLLPYLLHLWRSAHKVQLYHVMANSGWSWHLFAAPAIWMAKIMGKPVIVNYRGGEAAAFFDQAFTWVKPSLSRADAIIVPSGFLEIVFRKRGFSTHIVPNIIDLSRFSVADNIAAGLTSDSPCILVARNLEPIYDNATALHAFRIVKNALASARFVIAGSGPERQMLEKLATELGLTDAITFTGRVENANMAKLYYSADVMVNPSLVDNMPISVLEALASGVPVVSTDVGGVPYLVEHEKTALLVPPQNPAAMADAILALLTNPVKASRIKQAGIESVQQYTWPKVRTRLLSVYEQVLNKRNQPVVENK